MNERIESYMAYRWIGRDGEFIDAIPTRDLTGADLLRLEDQEGITEADIATCGLYERVEMAEIEPFCGAPTADGGRCRRPVAEWGERCFQHGAVEKHE